MSKPALLADRDLMQRFLGDPDLWDAYELAEFAHHGQLRQTSHGAVPYLLHPLRVFVRLLSWGVSDKTTLVAALLHDTVEDAPERVSQFLGAPGADALTTISGQFGAEVAQVVDGLTNRPDAGYVEHVSQATRDPRVLTVKLSDFADNAGSLDPAHPRFVKLSAKYAPLYPVLELRLRESEQAQALIPAWDAVLGWVRATVGDYLRVRES